MQIKIDINKIKLAPAKFGFHFCVFGEPNQEIVDWAKSYGFVFEKSGKFTNILVPKNFDISNCFEESEPFDYIDGFSPNLNKTLHVGHLSNLIIAKSFQGLGVGKEFVAILGDTLKGEVSKDVVFGLFEQYCSQFNYKISQTYFASKVSCEKVELVDGSGEYENTKIFDLGDEKIVGIKSNGSTSYFYQDVALAEKMSGKVLYLTGSVQEGHFNSLKKLFPDVEHMPLGLVLIDGKKMSSRNGNVIMVSDIIKQLMDEFNEDIKLVYNVIAGLVLKSVPTAEKKITLATINQPKLSPGLYLSYTMARLKSAGVPTEINSKFNSNKLQFAYIKSKENLSPNILLSELVEHCKLINKLYGELKIKGNQENQVLFSSLYEDLKFGANKLGMFIIDKV